MSKYKILFGAVLSSLLFSGAVVAHGVTSNADGDVITGHSSDHKDPALVNSRKAQAPEMGHTSEDDKEDIIHKVTVHKEELGVSKGDSPAEHSRSGHDDQEDVLHEITKH